MATKNLATTHMPEPEIELSAVTGTIADVELVVQKVHAYNVKRWQDVLRRSEEANEGWTPTVDRNGRCHAPRDGYIDPETERVYRGGSYLPFPEDYYMDSDGGMRFRGGSYTSSKGWRHQERVKMPVSAAVALGEAAEALLTKDGGSYGGYFEVGAGKSWSADGVDVCYAYIKAAYLPVLGALLAYARKDEYVPPVVEYPVWEEARRTIVGVVLTIKQYPSPFGGTDTKMIVQADDGNKTFGTVPASLEVEAGERVSFDATVKMKEPGFYYFKRPTNAVVLKEAP